LRAVTKPQSGVKRFSMDLSPRPTMKQNFLRPKR
jgi:hypothetical protein